jgi:transcriptional regulator GlxA family with amidase domain
MQLARDVARRRGGHAPRPLKATLSALAHPFILERDAAGEECPAQGDAALQPELRVGFILWPDFTMLALAGFVDSLRLAADVGDRSNQIHCSWTVMSVDATPLRSSCGLAITPDSLLRNPRHFDYVVVVGGLIRSFPHVNPELRDYLRAAARAGIPLVGVCTGGIALAECGLMKNRQCCVARYHHSDLVSRAPDTIPVSNRLFIDDGDRISCAGGAASIDLATYLVERHCGSDRAIKLVHAMILDEARAPAHAQRRLGIDDFKVTDVRLGRALIAMEHQLNEPLSMNRLAKLLRMSRRQLQRLFVSTFGRSPTQVFRLMRVQHGRWLLENSTLSLMKIAFECGFCDSSHFIRSFVEETECTPGEYRRRLHCAGRNQRPAGHPSAGAHPSSTRATPPPMPA